MTPQESSQRAYEICAMVKVMPVLVVEERAYAMPLAEALVSGGINVLEVTLRTDAALDVIEDLSAKADVIVGAGTLLSADDVKRAKDAGAAFGVSPGTTDEVLNASLEVGLPMLPGAATPSEVMRLLGAGFDMLKLFPAEAVGGRNLLKSIASPLPKARFCPTGGIKPETASDYLSLGNVVCVGGSWVANEALMRNGEWGQIAQNASETANL